MDRGAGYGDRGAGSGGRGGGKVKGMVMKLLLFDRKLIENC